MTISRLSVSGSSARKDAERRWWEKIAAADRCHYSLLSPATAEVIGILAFTGIDWDKGSVANMGIRIRSDLCGRGYGRETLSALLTAVLDAGMCSIRLDVAAANQRAVTCYEKCGMRIVGEFWREHRGAQIEPGDPKWSFAMPHLRRDGDKWVTRFYWMEIGGRSAIDCC